MKKGFKKDKEFLSRTTEITNENVTDESVPKFQKDPIISKKGPKRDLFWYKKRTKKGTHFLKKGTSDIISPTSNVLWTDALQNQMHDLV